MSLKRIDDPYEGWSTEQLEEHGRRWCSLPMIQAGPISVPPGHPEGEPDDEDIPLGEVIGWVLTGAVILAAVVATIGAAAYLLSLAPQVAMYASVTR